MIKLIKKIIRRFILGKNKLPVFLFKGNIKLGCKTRFNQPLILMGGYNSNRELLFFWL